MKILVTGGCGQLGMSLRPLLPGAVFADIVDAPDTVHLDITDLAAIRSLVASEGIDTIINCAAYTNVEGAEDNEALAEKLNAGAVENLAIAMKEAGGLLVHISTDYVFGGEPCLEPIGEDRQPSPMNAYGRTKLHGEEAIISSGVRHVIIRTAWLYSEFGKNFVKTMLGLTASRPTLKVVADQTGTPTYAGDLATVIVTALDSIRKGSDACGIYNYSNEGICSWYDFAKAIADISGHTSCDVQPCSSAEFPSKVRRPSYSVLDKTRIKQTFSIDIPFWKDSLIKCITALESQA